MSHPWYDTAVFYHIYPLGLCDAPERNDFRSAPVDRIEKLVDWIPHLASIGVTAVYLGPIFESASHGYDTVDFTRVDRRLGTAASLVRTIQQYHEAGIRVVLDGVFNHVGRGFFAFEDIRRRKQNSAYTPWIAGLNFHRNSPLGDAFTYESWEGHYNLVKLNLRCPAAADYLLKAVRKWVDAFDIDGLRLDVAYLLDKRFLRDLRESTREAKSDFWLMGEVIHGDYRDYVSPTMLDSVTNYEAYKSLYSSFNDKNLFEIAHSMDRQFGPAGMYRTLQLYNFTDNHDVNRVASQLRETRHLKSLYLILFTMPGLPSIYYGSEWGIEGKRGPGTDRPLRPALDLEEMNRQPQGNGLVETIRRYAEARRSSPALLRGSYQPLHVASEQLAFSRSLGAETLIVAVNAAERAYTMEIAPGVPCSRLVDAMDHQTTIPVHGSTAALPMPPSSGRILKVEG